MGGKLRGESREAGVKGFMARAATPVLFPTPIPAGLPGRAPGGPNGGQTRPRSPAAGGLGRRGRGSPAAASVTGAAVTGAAASRPARRLPHGGGGRGGPAARR